jgi:hypothetical protein
MTPDQKKIALDQIDRAISASKQIGSSSSKQYGNQVAAAITIIGSTIERLAPVGSTYRTETDRILKMWGATNSTCLEYLPGILSALRSDIDGGYLQSITELIHASVFSDFLDMAEYLLNEGYKDPAAVLTGGVLEEHLRKLADKYGVPTVVNARAVKADQLNADLVRGNAYSVLYQKSITAWLDLRNKAAHGKYTEYTKEQVALMLAGVRDFAAKFPA